jgi:hypothetical protein
MTTKHESVSQDQTLSPANGGKRPYLKPAFSSESVFETMALACGKIAGQAQDQCRRVASNS